MVDRGGNGGRRCRGSRRDGSPCQAPATAVGASGYCWAHDPANAAARREAQAKGGRHKATTARLGRLVPATLKPVLGTLIDALDEVRGEGGQPPALSPQQAQAMAALARAAVAVFQVAELEPRLARLEEAAQDGRRGA
jgi:hypothetical protein